MAIKNNRTQKQLLKLQLHGHQNHWFSLQQSRTLVTSAPKRLNAIASIEHTRPRPGMQATVHIILSINLSAGLCIVRIRSIIAVHLTFAAIGLVFNSNFAIQTADGEHISNEIIKGSVE